MNWLQNGTGFIFQGLYSSVYISCNYACSISFLEKILLIKLKYLYIQYTGISIMKKQNSNQNEKVEKMMLLVKTFDHDHHKFQLFQLSCKIVKGFEIEIQIEI